MSATTERVQRIALGSQSTALAYLPYAAAGLDVAVIGGTVLLASLGRQRLPVFDTEVDLTSEVGLVGTLVVAAWVTLVALLGGYKRDVFGASTHEYRRVLNASLLAAGVLGVGCYVAQYPLARGFYLLIFLIGLPGLLAGRVLLRRVIHAARNRGIALQRVVVAGSLAHADEVAAVLRRESWLGYDVVGVVTPPHQRVDESAVGIPVLGDADDVCALATAAQADVIVFAGGAVTSSRQLREILWELEQHDFHVVVAPSVSEISGDRITVRPVGGLPLIHIDPPAWVKAARIGKRLFDLTGALTWLLVLSPLLAACAIRVKLHDHGPVLFRQTRIGKDGVAFDCYKFRTMVLDAESLLAELQARQAFEGGLFKMPDDPRVTGPGRWLRRFSLDELPQLLNVVRGEMSLVGPRPPLPSEVLAYADSTSRRLRVRPGMTGLWQVSGRSDLSFEEAIRLDLYYVDNWSMLQDLSILMRTVGAVLSSRGAY